MRPKVGPVALQGSRQRWGSGNMRRMSPRGWKRLHPLMRLLLVSVACIVAFVATGFVGYGLDLPAPWLVVPAAILVFMSWKSLSLTLEWYGDRREALYAKRFPPGDEEA